MKHVAIICIISVMLLSGCNSKTSPEPDSGNKSSSDTTSMRQNAIRIDGQTFFFPAENYYGCYLD